MELVELFECDFDTDNIVIINITIQTISPKLRSPRLRQPLDLVKKIKCIYPADDLINGIGMVIFIFFHKGTR